MAECPHGLDEAWCSSCKHPYRPPEPLTVQFTFNARYDGHCAVCNLPIVYNERICRMSDDTFQHAACAIPGYHTHVWSNGGSADRDLCVFCGISRAASFLRAINGGPSTASRENRDG